MQTLGEIRDRWLGCDRCPLAETRKNVVFGEGNPQAELMLIGEAPGAQEDLLGTPFVGDSGTLLDKLLQQAGLSRDNLFITNIVACRPPRNRKPAKEEINACLPRLYDTIYAVDPLVIVLLGDVAMKTLTAKKSHLTAVRGSVVEIRIPGKATGVVYPGVITLHPAFLLRNPETSPDGWIQQVIDDLTWAGRLVTEILSH